MADRGSFGLAPRLDIQQLFIEAQHRWLRPAEICEILRNYEKFHISTEPPNKPASGSLFLFDRKVLRYFRKDGHNWRKKKDGKTVKEAHEKLKVGSVDVLHCYYAHGEETESFQRRSYWMLEQELMHIVFVHYLEVKGNRTHSSPSNSLVNHNRSGNTDSVSPSSTLSSAFEDADSADSHQTTGTHSFHRPQLQSSVTINKVDVGPSSTHLSHSHAGPGGPVAYGHGSGSGINDSSSNIINSQGLTSWEDVYEQSTRGFDNTPLRASLNSPHLGNYGVGGNLMQQVPTGSGTQVNLDGSLPIHSSWQIPAGDSSLHFPPGINPTIDMDLAYDFGTRLFDQRTQDFGTHNTLEPYFTGSLQQHDQLFHNNLGIELLNSELQHATGSNPPIEGAAEGNGRYALFAKKPLLGEESLKKVDSFSRWVSKELGEVDDLNMKSSSGIAWSNVECGNVADESVLSPSLSQDQLFSIMDFSPKWAYADSETEVHIVGMFLKSREEVQKCDWSCMFGEVEVRAEVLADGILCCFAPPHGLARVPLYVTCSNRVACSEVREFDYLVNSVGDVNVRDVYGGNGPEMWFHLRLEKLLSVKASPGMSHTLDVGGAKQKLVRKIMLLKEEDDNHQMTELTSEETLSHVEVKRKLLHKLIKENLYAWLLHKVLESGKGPCVLDDDGQGVLHLAAALGWDWAIKPTVAAGVSINFRDVNGWTALHWAAYCGREQTVAVLVSWRAAPGALTDPSPEFPSGRTAAELASGNGHKGISGFLAESFLTSYLSTLTVKEQKEDGLTGENVVQTIEERTATPLNGNDVPDALSLKDSLTAIRNATQAANRIYQVFRMQSFQRKQLSEHESDEFGLSDEHALSLLARRPQYSNGKAHAAATQIQKKFRGWKKRREFLIIRQRIVKIQAHIRGHQVRKQYKTVVWSVGILEKIILRWRRKGSGLRGFRRDAMVEDSSPQNQNVHPKEDDYDYLKEGRKQNEERVEKTLNRVKSMFHDPNGRAQYRRLLTVVEGLRENQACSSILNNPQDETEDGEDEESSQQQIALDFDSLLDDDTFMSLAFD